MSVGRSLWYFCKQKAIYKLSVEVMSEAVVALLKQFKKLSARERSEFLAASLNPNGDYGDWSNDDAVLLAAQSFARLDAEEEANGKSEAGS